MGDLVTLPVRFAGLIPKSRLARAEGRSTRWVEMQMAAGAPFTRDANGYTLFDLEAFRRWRAERESANG